MADELNNDLLRLVRDLERARRAFIEAVQVLPHGVLDAAVDESGWTARRVVEYCRASERWHFTRVFSFFEAEVKIYDSPAACLDHAAPESPELTLARECAEVWLAGRETGMWLDVLEGENVDAVRHASSAWPQGGWTIREVFRKVTALYRDKTKTLKGALRG